MNALQRIALAIIANAEKLGWIVSGAIGRIFIAVRQGQIVRAHRDGDIKRLRQNQRGSLRLQARFFAKQSQWIGDFQSIDLQRKLAAARAAQADFQRFSGGVRRDRRDIAAQQIYGAPDQLHVHAAAESARVDSNPRGKIGVLRGGFGQIDVQLNPPHRR